MFSWPVNWNSGTSLPTLISDFRSNWNAPSVSSTSGYFWIKCRGGSSHRWAAPLKKRAATEAGLPTQPTLLVKSQGSSDRLLSFFFLIALPGLQMLQKNTTKQCSQEVKSFSSAMRGCVFFYAADCLEVRNCSLTGCIFLTAWAGTGGTDRPLCQMKTETWDGRVGRQWFNDTAGGWFPSASLTFLAAVLQRPLLMALRKQNAGRILCNSYCCHYYELCSLPETFTHKLWIEFLFGIYFCIYILT